MSETLMRHEPVTETPCVAHGVRISLAPPMQRHTLRARNAQDLERVFKVKIPTKIGASEGGIMCLGPDEWYLRSQAGATIPTSEGLPVAVADVFFFASRNTFIASCVRNGNTFVFVR